MRTKIRQPEDIISEILAKHEKTSVYDQTKLETILDQIRILSDLEQKKDEFWILHFDEVFNFILDMLDKSQNQ